MEKLNKADIPKEAFDLYDYYCHNKLDRRTFIEKLSVYAVGGITVTALLGSMMPDYASGRTVVLDDERLQSSDYMMYNSPKGGGQIKALLSTPTGKGKFPGIVVVHENRGLNPYIEDVGRRCAVDGFISLAPDALTPLGGYPGNDDEGRAMQAKRTREEMLEDFIAAYEFLKTHPDCNGKVGVVGFCFGGWISNMMAVRIPDLKAAVPYYGGQPEAAEVAQIQAPLLVIYAELDERVNAGWPAYEAALKANRKDYEMINYPGVNHGFHNYSTPRYDEAAAKVAWEKTIAFFRKNLN
ncbi:MAG: dienelactone hydrolase family protein [Bacteroidetes bacterium]|nr:dienelactone hydrolase family protein [Bacteroidota bacterium]